MVAISRKSHADLVASPETRSKHLPSNARELFDALPSLPGLRTEIIDGKLIVSPVGTPEHGWNAMLIYEALRPVVLDRDWRAYVGNVDVCIDGPRDPVEPDFVLAPANCPRWGQRELLSSGLLLVAEIVSPGSVMEDRDRKPQIYAAGGVPVMLLVDPVASPPSVTVFSEPKDGEYLATARVPFGGSLHIPAPVDFLLETKIFQV